MSELRIYLLGGFQVTVDGQPVTAFEADSARALLTYVALNPAYPLRREQLAQLLWADQPREHALVNLRAALSRLRHALADKNSKLPFILAGRQDIQLNPHASVWVDVQEIERRLMLVKNHAHRHLLGCPWCLGHLTQLDQVYRGEFLHGLFVNSVPFEEWQAVRREELHRLVVQTWATLAEHSYSWGAYTESERYTRRELALEPWNEEAHQQLMRTLLARGSRSAALAQYAICRAHLRDELGIEPSDTITDLYNKIRANPHSTSENDRDQFSHGGAVLSAGKARFPNNLPIPTTVFSGRETELDLLLERLVSPSNRLITLVGEDDVGKTRLALAASHALVGSFADGVWWINLADLVPAGGAQYPHNRLATQIALALGLARSEATDATERLVRYICDKELLLVLDSFEHLMNGANVVRDLLQAGPKLALLITSRQPLHVRGEYTLRLDQLPRLDADDPQVYTSSAVQLGTEQASHTTNGFNEVRLHNLPQPLTSFVGRSQELATLVQLLGTTQLLTLIGPGGTGKTRLSLALAHAVRAQFSAGAWLIDLASLADPALVLPTLAMVFGLREEPGALLLQRLLDLLSEKQLLLVFDNCEHLIDTCAQLTEQLVTACPDLTILASSREPLRVAGETHFQVPALSFPHQHRRPSLAELSRSEAVQLFVERARLVNDSFALTEANAAGVTQICAQLDGIPLAIELAAARLRMLTVGQITARLSARFRLLTNGSRTALPRHQTLQALIDWSYNLLSEQARALLCHLAVFAGGWTLEAAEAVCTSAMIGDVLDALTDLVNKSMVQVELDSDVARYRILETIRQYALEKLVASGQADIARRRHADYYRALAEMAEEHIRWRTTQQAEWLALMEIEHDNLRAALSFCIERMDAQPVAAGVAHADGSSSFSVSLDEAGVQLAGSLGPFWDTRGHLSEGRAWLARALAHGQMAAPAVRAKALNQAGRLAWSHDDISNARALFEASLELFRSLQRQDDIAHVLYDLGQLALAQGDLTLAAALFGEALTLRRVLGDQRGIAWILESLGDIARYQGAYAHATALAHEALALFERFGDSGSIAHAKWTLGHIARSAGDDAGATAYYDAALAGAQDVGDGALIASIRHNQAFLALHRNDYVLAEALLLDSLAISREIEAQTQIAWDLAALGGVAALRGQSAHAGRLLGAVDAWFEATNTYTGPTERAEHDRYRAVARAQISAATFAEALTIGRVMSLDQALAYALGKHKLT